jgi:hypothetical protein
MKFIKDNFLSVVILVLLSIVILQKCGAPAPVEAPTVVRDTTWIVKDSLIFSKPQVIKSISVESHDTIINHYIPDTNYARLADQYQKVVAELLAKNIHQDSVLIDSTGYVKIIDTVQKNLLVSRSTYVNVKHPIIKEVITIPEKKVRQLYFGGGVSLDKPNFLSLVKTGVVYKNKKDQLFLGSVGIGMSGVPQFGLESYWKIKLKK